MAEQFDPDAYIKEMDIKGFDPDEYLKEQDSDAKMLAREAVKTLPIVGSMIGGAAAGGATMGAATLGGSALGAAGGKVLQNAIEQNFFDDKKTIDDYTTDVAKEAAYDVAGNLVGYGVVEPVLKAAGASTAAKYLGRQAGKLAEKATGATGKQSEKFAEGAGETLLKDGYVGWFDTPDDIARKAKVGITKAETGIDEALKLVDQSGIKVDANVLVEDLSKKVAELRQDPAKADVADKLEKIIENIYNSGVGLVTPSKAEKTKRGFNEVARSWLDPEKGQAGKIAYRAYRDAVEAAATKVSPEIANSFKESKKLFGFLNPIEDAARKRAATLNQSPFGGFLDTTAAAAGGLAGGGTGAVVTTAGRRMLAPMASSFGANLVNTAAKGVEKAPQRVVSELTQYLGDDLLNMIAPPMPKPETPSERARRVNVERKAAKGM